MEANIATKSAADLVSEARRKIENLPPDMVFNELEYHDVLLVDLRESEERQEQGVIPGSIHAPRGRLEFYADPSSPYHKSEFDPTRRVILHCGGGGRSALAAAMLKEMGYSHVAHLDGGFKAWKAAGYPVNEL